MATWNLVILMNDTDATELTITGITSAKNAENLARQIVKDGLTTDADGYGDWTVYPVNSIQSISITQEE